MGFVKQTWSKNGISYELNQMYWWGLNLGVYYKIEILQLFLLLNVGKKNEIEAYIKV